MVIDAVDNALLPLTKINIAIVAPGPVHRPRLNLLRRQVKSPGLSSVTAPTEDMNVDKACENEASSVMIANPATEITATPPP